MRPENILRVLASIGRAGNRFCGGGFALRARVRMPVDHSAPALHIIGAAIA
jgi:hypothetical protein